MEYKEVNYFFNLIREDIAPWFGNLDTPILDSILWGCSVTDQYIYSIIYDVNLQTRAKTATGLNLNLVSQDFFGDELPRRNGESDTSYRNRILTNLIQVKDTRLALIQILTALTGRVPYVMDSMSYEGMAAYDSTYIYDNYGAFTMDAAYTGIIYAYRPQPVGFYFMGGYDSTFGDEYSGFSFGYDKNYNNAYTGPVSEIEFVTDQDILETIRRSKVFGTKIYTTIFD